MFYKVGSTVYDDFLVLDESNNPVIGINPNDFSVKIYNPDGNEVSGTVSYSFSELGDGHYRFSFTPDATGKWSITIFHSTYFPWGKHSAYDIHAHSLLDITEMLMRSLGLMQENYHMDNILYNDNDQLVSARIRIYSNAASVGTDSDVIATYMVEATYDPDTQRMETYRVERI